MNKKKLSKAHKDALRRGWIKRKAKGLGIPWNKDKRWSIQHKKKLKKAWIKRKEKGLGIAWNKGKKLSQAHARHCRIAMLGKKHTEATKEKMRITHKGKKNGLWKGDNVGYHGLHLWVGRHLGKPTTCEHCGKDGLTGRQIHWANKSRKYLRKKSDWIRLCVKCHKKYDKNIIVKKNW
jgi:hypothetical protein